MKTMSSALVTRRMVALSGIFGLLSTTLARAQDAPSFTTSEVQSGLLTVQVSVDNTGPYSFAIDSAANTSVIAQDLASRLSLSDAGDVTMHTVVASERALTVRAGRIRTGALDVRGARLVVADRRGLSGLDGLLGTDLLGRHRLVLNFRGRTSVDVRRPRVGGAINFDGVRIRARRAVRGEQRFNGLLLIDAMAGTIPCKAIVDTGAMMSVINTALARQAGAYPLTLQDGASVGRIQSPTGRSADGETMLLPTLQLDDARLTRLPVLAGDFHTFGVWGLVDQPAILLGVDVLGLFQTVIIDLKRGELLLAY